MGPILSLVQRSPDLRWDDDLHPDVLRPARTSRGGETTVRARWSRLHRREDTEDGVEGPERRSAMTRSDIVLYCGDILILYNYSAIDKRVVDTVPRLLGPYAWSTNSLPIANGTISPYILTLVYRYVSAIVPLTSLLVLHAYGPWSLTNRHLGIDCCVKSKTTGMCMNQNWYQ